jgi:hypothetical protein
MVSRKIKLQNGGVVFFIRGWLVLVVGGIVRCLFLQAYKSRCLKAGSLDHIEIIGVTCFGL